MGRLLDRRAAGWIAVAGHGVAALCYSSMMIFTDTLSLSCLLGLIFALGFTHAVFPFLFKSYSEVCPPDRLGVAIGICNASPFIGALVFQLLTGYLFEYASGGTIRSLMAYRYFFLLLTVALWISTIAVRKVSIWREKELLLRGN